ncbi:MAG: leucine-rich repeat domain-containing protein, partial [Anaerolineae bacterium]|nr:leucine-rich repeat domain-containing protein [Anaerolineae bacterium]
MPDPIDPQTAQTAYAEALKRIEKARKTDATELSLYDLPLTELPPEIGSCTALETLKLAHEWNLSESNCRLQTLPVEIGQLTKLMELYLRQNSLSTLPAEIGQLTKLKRLDLSQNNLSVLPAEIGHLTNLISLYLWQNRLRQLPAEIGHLTNLRWLDLRENRLSQLPVEISHLNNLTSLNLGRNPGLPIPSELLQRGAYNPQIFLDFWQEYISQQTHPLYEVKMILVGEGSVGKTSLVRRLTVDEFDHAEAQTKGINIETWPVEVAASKGQGTAQSAAHQVETHIWDFGGQEIMHATHQFFLTDRSLYLLVLDARQGERESRVEYWLSLIESFAGESPIIIVLNKCDQHFLDLNRRGLLKKYPNIAGFVQTSAATGKGLAELKQTISQTIAAMPHVDTPFPLTWFNVKERLAEMAKSHNYLGYGAYKRICQEEEVVEDSKQRTLIRFLHDLGIVLNFQDDARVRDTSILNPEWVTEGVYHLLNQEALARQGGVLPISQLPDLLDGERYPLERQGFILQMMEKFELAYPFDGGDRYLIPDLLPV